MYKYIVGASNILCGVYKVEIKTEATSIITVQLLVKTLVLIEIQNRICEKKAKMHVIIGASS